MGLALSLGMGVGDMGYDSSVGCEECRHGEAFSESRGNFCARTYIFVMGEEGAIA